MTIDSIIEAVGGTEEVRAALVPYWETSLATLGEEQIEFLSEDFIRKQFDYIGLHPDLLTRVVALAERIEADPALRLLIWHGYRRLVYHPDSGPFADWPALEETLGEEANGFFFLIALATVPLIRQAYAAVGVPAEIVRDSCAVVGAQLRGLVAATGMPRGSTRRSLSWLRHHLAGQIARLGRMEWLKRRFQGNVHIYRHRTDGRVIALSAGGMQVDAEGYYIWPDDGATESTWTTQLEFAPRKIHGYPIDPGGFVQNKQVTLDRTEWVHRLSPGMPCIDMHIPAGGAMTLQACEQSFRQAADFFARYFSDWGAQDFSCTSWILNPELQAILPESANLCQLQRHVYLFPHPTAADNGLYFIFGGEKLPDRLPATASRLQRAIWESIHSGRRWRGGGMFFLQSDLAQFGQRPYAKNAI